MSFAQPVFLVFQLCPSNPTQHMDVTKLWVWTAVHRKRTKKFYFLSYGARVAGKLTSSLDESVITACKRKLEETADLKDLQHMKQICKDLKASLQVGVRIISVSRSLVDQISFGSAPFAQAPPSIKEHSSQK
jgi:hypothetical protein